MAVNEASASTASTATLPSALAFLVSNFHSLVNIKLDGSNYMLWRIQVESVMEANGFYGYLDGSIQSPPSEVRNAQGEVSINPAYTLWKLIDSQLKSCLNASLSQATLPYVLGLRYAYQVWDSLGKRYNTITESHVQELKDELYSVSKTSTIEAYVDKIQEIAQKLTAAGCVVEEDELVFRTLQGLPKAFNGLRTAVRAVRTRGTKMSFDELVSMMKSEDTQLSKEASDIEGSNTVLIASHSRSQNSNLAPVVPQNSSSLFNQGVQSGGSGNQGYTQQQVGSQQYFPSHSQQFGSNSSRNFNRGRGGRKFHCDICGRNNHSTNYCYYRPNGPGHQWRGYSNAPQLYPPMYGSQGMPGMPVVQTMTPQFNIPQGQHGGFKTNGSTFPMVHSYIPSAPSVMSQSSSVSSPVPSTTAFAGFTGQCSMPCAPYSVPNFYFPPGVSGGEMMHANTYPEMTSTAGSGSQPCSCYKLILC
ncbi:hypothetical protein Vadar_021479 [Vaccinium darrowii]|uniref:Uncharacterized protein n=1 Tax=Vaccinium darrowii TaxID=229202 RepID=A0ACB7XIZ0_9ERIC|nr:hypothetical protein Vadar_021479 [Vaccinium darrowii]